MLSKKLLNYICLFEIHNIKKTNNIFHQTERLTKCPI